jgi:biopolymer transport protein ExbD
MQNLHSLPINLPQGHAAPMPVQAKNTVTLTVTKEGKIFLDKTPVTIESLASTLKPMLTGTESNVIVAADGAATNGVTIQAMLKAREAGAQHFLIAVKHVD